MNRNLIHDYELVFKLNIYFDIYQDTIKVRNIFLANNLIYSTKEFIYLVVTNKLYIR